MPLIYRRTRGTTTWHFREDCPHWPVADFEQEAHTPRDGVCCMACTYWPPSAFATRATRAIAAPERSVARARAAGTRRVLPWPEVLRNRLG